MEKTKKIVQIAPQRIVKDVETIWHEAGDEVDIVMNVKNPSFRDGSIDTLFVFHVLDYLYEEEVIPTLLNWRRILKDGGEMYIVVNDFEYLSRAVVGGDINVDMYNKEYSSAMKFTKDSIVSYLNRVGFQDDKMRFWYVDPANLFKKEEHEIVINIIKS